MTTDQHLHTSRAHRPTRRDVLRGTVGLAAALGAGGLVGRATPAAAATIDYTEPSTFDEFLSAFEARRRLGQASDYNDIMGALAWGQSYVQQGLLRIHDAYPDRRYVDALVDHVDDVLATRDGERGVVDYRGLSLPAWRTNYPYTAGAVDLADAAGRPVLQVRSVNTPIENLVSYTGRSLNLTPNIDVTVAAGTMPGTFRLTVHHRVKGTTDVLDDLTMDTVAGRVYDAWPTKNLLTVQDLRPSGSSSTGPAPGTFSMASQNCIFAVHTGMITYSVAWFARIIGERPELRRDPSLRRKAATYTEACEEAVAVHDREWRQNDRGEGWYVFAKGLPVDLDGSELPANQFLAMARTLFHLAAITGNPRYADRATRMARTFRNQLTVGADDAYAWHYWLTWGLVYNGWPKDSGVSAHRLSWGTARQAEDISHGHIDVDLAVEAFRAHRVFTGRDMARLARTYTENVMTTTGGAPTVWSNVDGTGVTRNLSFDLVSAGWMPLALWDDRVLSHTLAVYQADDLRPDYQFLSGYMLLGVANLAWFAKIGG